VARPGRGRHDRRSYRSRRRISSRRQQASRSTCRSGHRIVP
jgi:hypothetical protein